MTTHSDRDGSELNRFTSPQETTGATPAPLGTSAPFSCGYCGHGTENPLGICGPCRLVLSEHWTPDMKGWAPQGFDDKGNSLGFTRTTGAMAGGPLDEGDVAGEGLLGSAWTHYLDGAPLTKAEAVEVWRQLHKLYDIDERTARIITLGRLIDHEASRGKRCSVCAGVEGNHDDC